MGETQWRYLLPGWLRSVPADLAAVIAYTALVNVAVFVPLVRETPLRVVVGIGFVLFVPGYALIAALFPEAGAPPDEEPDDGLTDRGIDGIERAALSFGLSIAVVPLVGLALSFTPWGLTLGPIMVSLSGFAILMAAVATVRRSRLPPEDRFAVPYRSWIDGLVGSTLEAETRTDAALNVALVCSIVLAVGVLSFAVLFPPQGETFSALYLLTEDDDGELVAANYPSEIEVGEDHEIIVGIDNSERETVEYTVVVLEQATETDSNETTVIEEQELDRFEITLDHDETAHEPYDLAPTIPGEDNRIMWLLFPGDVPDEPSEDDTEYTTHLWIDVVEPE